MNFSARTVISPDPLLSINEVGVPIIAARELTVPVHVNEHNIEKIREMVARGPSPTPDKPYLPGVNYVIRSDGRRIRVTDRNAADVAGESTSTTPSRGSSSTGTSSCSTGSLRCTGCP